ncbi:hypothetical protein [Actinoplanes sp. NPDC049118]|uniref:hypothetical protein n=1 Tax=Actinoplanes sp. NPDC049118 TaxID=3155769 RepID=UPI003401DC7B
MRFVLELQRAVCNSAMPSTGRHIMLTLAIKADWETGVIPCEHSPSLTTLAVMTGLAKSTIVEWLDVLETAGWIKRDRPPKGSRDERTGYVLLIGAAYVPKPQRASRRTAASSDRRQRGPLNVTETGKSSTFGSAPGDPVRQADSSDTGGLPDFGSPPGGPVHLADTPSSPPGGTPAVRLADTGSPPGGHASIRNSPSESSTSGRRSARATPGRPAAGTAAAGRRRATRIPADFAATDEMIAWARSDTPNVGARETAAFVDYWSGQPGEKGEKYDWKLAWRIWMRREQKSIELSPGFRGTPVQTAVDATPAPRPDAVEMCAEHRQAKAHCGLCRSEKYLAPWDREPAPTEAAPAATGPDAEPDAW